MIHWPQWPRPFTWQKLSLIPPLFQHLSKIRRHIHIQGSVRKILSIGFSWDFSVRIFNLSWILLGGNSSDSNGWPRYSLGQWMRACQMHQDAAASSSSYSLFNLRKARSPLESEIFLEWTDYNQRRLYIRAAGDGGLWGEGMTWGHVLWPLPGSHRLSWY